MSADKTTPKLNFTLLCDDVRQELGGKYSLMGLFESIFAGAFPATHRRFAIVSEWSGGKGEFSVRTRLLAPDREQVLSESETKLVLFNELQRHRDISVRFDTTFRTPGAYWIETLLDGKQAGMTPLTVQMTGREPVH
jgi:hypothetical protein